MLLARSFSLPQGCLWCRGTDPQARPGGRQSEQGAGQLNTEKGQTLLTEKENEIRMKIDEAGRKGDPFHQQVCQMELRDKSRSGRSLGLRRARACPLRQLSRAGHRDKWLQLRPMVPFYFFPFPL